MNTKLRTKAKNAFEKDFLNWWIIQSLEKLYNRDTKIAQRY